MQCTSTWCIFHGHYQVPFLWLQRFVALEMQAEFVKISVKLCSWRHFNLMFTQMRCSISLCWTPCSWNRSCARLIPGSYQWWVKVTLIPPVSLIKFMPGSSDRGAGLESARWARGSCRAYFWQQVLGFADEEVKRVIWGKTVHVRWEMLKCWKVSLASIFFCKKAN